jgi:hypothetical protein
MAGTGPVEDEFWRGGVFLIGGEFAVHHGESAEELVGEVGEDGGAAGGDASFGEEDEDAGEGVVDVGGGVEVFEAFWEIGGDVGLMIEILREMGVAAAEKAVSRWRRQAAAGAVVEDVLAAGYGVDGIGVVAIGVHVFSLLIWIEGDRVPPPHRGICKRFKGNGLLEGRLEIIGDKGDRKELGS